MDTGEEPSTKDGGTQYQVRHQRANELLLNYSLISSLAKFARKRKHKSARC